MSELDSKSHRVVSLAEWLDARKQHLSKEKERNSLD
jgi:predicted dithiol-disulfide oxidoreductase (DUF899 family)